MIIEGELKRLREIEHYFGLLCARDGMEELMKRIAVCGCKICTGEALSNQDVILRKIVKCATCGDNYCCPLCCDAIHGGEEE